MRVFEDWAMEQMLRAAPAAALRVLADQVEAGEIEASLRSLAPIGGAIHEARDTFRVTLDLSVQLVKTEKGGR